MKMSKNRLEAFSDAVIAIIITIIVLDIPMQETFNVAGISNLLITLGIFFVGFIVVGAQWVKHHILFTYCKEVSSKVVWRNLIYLFFLSLIPFFTKWIMENPGQIVPTLGYDIIFFLVTLSFDFMQRTVIKESSDERLKKYSMDTKKSWIIALIYVILMIVIIYISFRYPTASIIFFILIPVVHSLSNIWHERNLGERKRYIK